MANIAAGSYVLIEVLVGERVGRNLVIEAATDAKDIIVGERYGLNLVIEASYASKDIAVGERYGLDLKAETSYANKDITVGERYGRNIIAEASYVVWEVLTKEANTRTSIVGLDILASIIEPIRPVALLPQLSEQALQGVERIPPASVISEMRLGSVSMQTTLARDDLGVLRSAIFAATERMQVTQYRLMQPAGDIRSPMYSVSLRELVTRSRGLVTPSVSAVFVGAEKMLSVQRRDVTLAPDVRTPIRSGNLREMITVSRVAVVTDIDDQAATLRELAVQQRTVVPPIGEERAASLREMVVMVRTISMAVTDFVGQVREAIVQQRSQAPMRSPINDGMVKQLTLQARDGGAPHSPTSVSTSQALVTMHRDVPDPAHVLGWSVYAARQLSTLVRATTPAPQMRSPILVGSEWVQYALGRTTIPPIDVIDPQIGRHAATLAQIAVLLRETLPPGDVEGMMRTVYNVVSHAAKVDTTFEPPPTEPDEPLPVDATSILEQPVARDAGPWEPVTEIKVDGLHQQAALTDAAGWADPTIPNSDAQVMQVMQATATVDASFPPGTQAQSEAIVLLTLQQPALADVFVPGTQPQSVLDVMQVMQATATVDATFPPGDQVQGEALVNHVSQRVVRRDLTISGTFPLSPADVHMAAMAVVMRDVTMGHMPTRARGPRPRVSVVRS